MVISFKQLQNNCEKFAFSMFLKVNNFLKKLYLIHPKKFKPYKK